MRVLLRCCALQWRSSRRTKERLWTWMKYVFLFFLYTFPQLNGFFAFFLSDGVVCVSLGYMLFSFSHFFSLLSFFSVVVFSLIPLSCYLYSFSVSLFILSPSLFLSLSLVLSFSLPLFFSPSLFLSSLSLSLSL